MHLSETEKEAFFDAIYHGDCARVGRWLAQGVSANLTNRGNETALQYAASYGQDACVEVLLLHGAACDSLPLVAAAAPRDPAVLRRFLALGADPNGVDAYGHTALMEAAGWGNAASVQALLEQGADPWKPSPSGITALDVARREGHLELLALLQTVSVGGAAGARAASPFVLVQGD